MTLQTFNEVYMVVQKRATDNCKSKRIQIVHKGSAATRLACEGTLTTTLLQI